MMAKRTPPPGFEPQPSLPHDHDREGGQPYAKEVEDYDHGVALPPEEQVARDADRSTRKTVPSPQQH
jgi:hypothetical protein